MPTIRGDEARLGQVFINLVHNAVKFSPEGGEVRVEVRREADHARASVTDHGIGIAKVDRARVFERFYKVDRARVRGGGTGLGLSIARHVVRGHGGRIWVESEEGAGSTFIFELPLTAEGRSARPPAPDGTAASESPGVPPDDARLRADTAASVGA
jgi:two-component system phosphate regulon sensor histidine kinase PhoR